jgi:hypothetical protein
MSNTDTNITSENVVQHGKGALCKECGGFSYWKDIRDTPNGREVRVIPTNCGCTRIIKDPPITLQDIETAVKEGSQVSVIYFPSLGEVTYMYMIETPEDMEAFETNIGNLLRSAPMAEEIKRYVSEDAFKKYFTTSSHNLVIL